MQPNLIKKRYVRNGEAAWFLEQDQELPDYMLTTYGKNDRTYGKTTNDTFGPEGKDQERKNYVESMIAKQGIDYCGSVSKILAVTGPNIGKHIDLYLRSDFAEVMHVPEMNPYTFEELVKNAKKYPEFFNHQLCLHLASADTFKVDGCKFIDLDLMKSFKITYDVIAPWLKFQSVNVFGKKAFTFTVGVRKDGGNRERFNSLERIFKILGADLKSIDGHMGVVPSAREYAERVEHLSTGHGRSCFSRKFEFHNKGRIDELIAYSYADGNPMLCVLILYQ